MSRKIGVLTGGGDCPGLNAVIRSVCLTAFAKGYKVVGLYDGFEGLYEPSTVDLDLPAVNPILGQGGTILGTANVGHFGGGKEIALDVIKRCKENFDRLGLACLVCIGGDGTMTIAYQLSLHGINVVGVPKTIDNDLRSTDQTFGFSTAVQVVTEALDRLHTTAASHHRVLVVEVMGRNAGWIALHSGVAGRANVILIPEVDWTWEKLMKPIKEKTKEPKMSCYSIVVVAEGAKIPEGGGQLNISGTRLGGIADLVSREITKQTGLESRVVVLGHVQRGGTPSAFDRILASQYGTFAAELACSGNYGKMSSLKGTVIVAVPITMEMQDQRLIDPVNEQLVQTARKCGICFGDEVEYDRKGTGLR